MKNKIAAVVLTVVVTLTLSLAAIAQVQRRVEMPPPQGNIGISIQATTLKCTPGTGSQDVVKTLRVTNTSGKTIPANTSIQFSTSDGEKDYRHFGNNIAPGSEFTINTNQPKNGAYTCSTWIRGTLK